jgi:hypothetical protein
MNKCIQSDNLINPHISDRQFEPIRFNPIDIVILMDMLDYEQNLELGNVKPRPKKANIDFRMA